MSDARALVRRGLHLEYVTLSWNVVAIFILAFAAIAARSVALGGFALDSLIEIGASIVVIWELLGTSRHRERLVLRLIGTAFIALAVYLTIQSTVVLATGHHAKHSPVGIVWTALTAAVMFALAWGKARTGAALANPVLQAEGRVTLIDGILATAVFVGLVANAGAGWWWADPAAGYVLVYYVSSSLSPMSSTSDSLLPSMTSWPISPPSAVLSPPPYCLVTRSPRSWPGSPSSAGSSWHGERSSIAANGVPRGVPPTERA